MERGVGIDHSKQRDLLAGQTQLLSDLERHGSSKAIPADAIGPSGLDSANLSDVMGCHILYTRVAICSSVEAQRLERIERLLWAQAIRQSPEYEDVATMGMHTEEWRPGS